MVYVNESLCTGCGECVDVCPSGAIRVVGSLAHIDQDLCQECQACVTACPNRAILVVQEVERAGQSIMVQMPSGASAPSRRGAPLAVTALPRTGLWPAVGAALAFVGREIIPRAAWALLDAWDRRQARSGIVSSPVVDSTRRTGHALRGGGRRLRRRGGWR
ncbi:MAG: 4Fe-4S binding protein [Thermoflexales bacterium]|nr:4Fe-4S binding protein [Thermoflexales bacterium]